MAILSAVDMLSPSLFPIEAILAVSTLDEGQAAALQAGLCQEVAVIQGPPGTGDWEVTDEAAFFL